MWLCLLQMFFLCGESFSEWTGTVHWSLLWQPCLCGAWDSPSAWLLPRAVLTWQRRLRGNCVQKDPIWFKHKLILFKFKKKKKEEEKIDYILKIVLSSFRLHLSTGSVRNVFFFYLWHAGKENNFIKVSQTDLSGETQNKKHLRDSTANLYSL